MTLTLRPSTFEEAAGELADAAAAGRTVRIRGGGTKLGWGAHAADPDVELRTTGLDRIVEHNAGDLTAVLEAGLPLARAQEAFAGADQMLALDPPLGRGSDRYATVGGMLATGDSGPLRHRYGAPRDLVLGMTVALSDGTIARAGSKVIKNVAGYDVGKLLTGSFGTLGLILSVSVRLHPLPADSATALAAGDDPELVAAAAIAAARAPLELEALDVAWRAGRGGVLARCGGAAAVERAGRAAGVLRDAGLADSQVAEDDDAVWARQRAGQRAGDGLALVRVAARPSALASVLGAVDEVGGTLIGRAALGSSYVELEPRAVASFRAALPRGAFSVLLDAPAWLREELDPWGSPDPGALELMRSLKARFDPDRILAPGVFVGGI